MPRPEGQGDDYDLIAAEVYPRYQRALRAQRMVDFDDLIALPVELLKKDAALREKYAAKFEWVLVDEYQDTNVCQLELLKLVGGARRNVCAVGDDDQAIYGWRGAEVKNILRFDRHFPGTKEVRLEQNYRSTGHILACANAVIAKNAARKEKRLWTSADPGEPVKVVALPGEDEEGEVRRGGDRAPARGGAALEPLRRPLPAQRAEPPDRGGAPRGRDPATTSTAAPPSSTGPR